MSSRNTRPIRRRPQPPPPGRVWVAVAIVLLLVSLSSWLTLIVALGIRQASCYDSGDEPVTARLCFDADADVGRSWRLVAVVAVLSALLLFLLGLAEGWQRRRFAYGSRQPLRVLIVTNPAGMVGYLLGWVIGRLLADYSDDADRAIVRATAAVAPAHDATPTPEASTPQQPGAAPTVPEPRTPTHDAAPVRERNSATGASSS